MGFDEIDSISAHQRCITENVYGGNERTSPTSWGVSDMVVLGYLEEV